MEKTEDRYTTGSLVAASPTAGGTSGALTVTNTIAPPPPLPPPPPPTTTAPEPPEQPAMAVAAVVEPPPPPPVINGPVTPEELRRARWIDYTSPSFVFYAIGVVLSWLPTMTASATGLDAHWRAVVTVAAAVISAVLTLALLLLRFGAMQAQATGLHLVLRAAGKINAGR